MNNSSFFLVPPVHAEPHANDDRKNFHSNPKVTKSRREVEIQSKTFESGTKTIEIVVLCACDARVAFPAQTHSQRQRKLIHHYSEGSLIQDEVARRKKIHK